MVRIDNKTGNIILEIEVKDKDFTACDELQMRRDALYDLITEHNTEEFVSNGAFHGAVLLLKDLDPTCEQWKQILKS